MAETRATLAKIVTALEKLWATSHHVVQTRILVSNIDQYEQVGRTHHEFFAGVEPATTILEVRRFIDPRIIVEIEADAVVEV